MHKVYFKNLCEAAKKNDVEKFKLILNEAKVKLPPASFNQIMKEYNEDGRALIHLISNSELMKFFLSHQADITLLTNPEGLSILDLYIEGEQRYDQAMLCFIVEYIIKNNIQQKNINDEKIRGLLEVAEKRGDGEVIVKFLSLQDGDRKIGKERKDIFDAGVKKGPHRLLGVLCDHIYKGDKESFSKDISRAIECPDFDIHEIDEKGETLFDHAIHARNPFFTETLLTLGFDPNTISRGISPMTYIIELLIEKENRLSSFFARGPLVKIAIQLMEHPKTNLKEHFGKDHSVMSKMAVLVRVEDLRWLAPKKAALLRKLKDVNMKGHCFDLRGIVEVDGYRCPLEGSQFGTSAKEMIQAFLEFTLDPGVRAELNECYNVLFETNNIDYFDPSRKEMDLITKIQADLSCIGSPMGVEEFQARFQNNQITPIYISISGIHAIAYLVYGNNYVRINCGYGIDDNEISGIQFYKIGDKKALMEEIPTLLNGISKPVTVEYLNKILPKNCQAVKTYLVPRPKQTAGNCTIKSLLETIFALKIAHISEHFINLNVSFEKSMEIAETFGKKLFDLFSRFFKERGIKRLNEIRHYFKDEDHKKIEDSLGEARLAYRMNPPWRPLFDGLFSRGPDLKTLADKPTVQPPFGPGDGKSGAEERKVVADRQQEKARIPQIEFRPKNESHTFTEEQLITIAKNVQMNDRQIKQLIEVLNGRDKAGVGEASYMIFLSQLDNVESILAIGGNPTKYSFLFTNPNSIEQYRKMIVGEKIAGPFL